MQTLGRVHMFLERDMTSGDGPPTSVPELANEPHAMHRVFQHHAPDSDDGVGVHVRDRHHLPELSVRTTEVTIANGGDALFVVASPTGATCPVSAASVVSFRYLSSFPDFYSPFLSSRPTQYRSLGRWVPFLCTSCLRLVETSHRPTISAPHGQPNWEGFSWAQGLHALPVQVSNRPRRCILSFNVWDFTTSLTACQ